MIRIAALRVGHCTAHASMAALVSSVGNAAAATEEHRVLGIAWRGRRVSRAPATSISLAGASPAVASFGEAVGLWGVPDRRAANSGHNLRILCGEFSCQCGE